MAGIVPDHQGKNRIFAKRKRELLHAIRHDHPCEKLVKLAEKLRVAKIAVFKCRFALKSRLEPHEFDPHEEAAHDKQIQRWLSMTPDEIVDMHRSEAN
jgi:hypothetical protein